MLSNFPPRRYTQAVVNRRDYTSNRGPNTKSTGLPSTGGAGTPGSTDLAVSVAQSHGGLPCCGMSSPLRLGVPGLTEREREGEGERKRDRERGGKLLLLLLVSSWLSTPTTVSKADRVVGFLKMGRHGLSSSGWGITFGAGTD